MIRQKIIALPQDQIPAFQWFGTSLQTLAITLNQRYNVELGIYGSGAHYLLGFSEGQPRDLDIVLSGDRVVDAVADLSQYAPPRINQILEGKTAIGSQYNWQMDHISVSITLYTTPPTRPLFDDVAHSLVIWLPTNRVESRAGDVALASYLAKQKLIYYPPHHTPNKMIWRAAYRLFSGWTLLHPNPGDRFLVNHYDSMDNAIYRIGADIARVFATHVTDWSNSGRYYRIIETLIQHLPEDKRDMIQAAIRSTLDRDAASGTLPVKAVHPDRPRWIRRLVDAVLISEQAHFRADLNTQLNALIEWSDTGQKIRADRRVLMTFAHPRTWQDPEIVAETIAPLLALQSKENQVEWIKNAFNQTPNPTDITPFWTHTPNALIQALGEYLKGGGLPSLYRAVWQLPPSPIAEKRTQLTQLLSDRIQKNESAVRRLACVQLIQSFPESIPDVLSTYLWSKDLSPEDRQRVGAALAPVLETVHWAPHIRHTTQFSRLEAVLPQGWPIRYFSDIPNTQWQIEPMIRHLPAPTDLQPHLVDDLTDLLAAQKHVWTDAIGWLTDAVGCDSARIRKVPHLQSEIITTLIQTRPVFEPILMSILSTTQTVISPAVMTRIETALRTPEGVKAIVGTPTVHPALLERIVNPGYYVKLLNHDILTLQYRLLTDLAAGAIQSRFDVNIVSMAPISGFFTHPLRFELLRRLSKNGIENLIKNLTGSEPLDWQLSMMNATHYLGTGTQHRVSHLLRILPHDLSNAQPILARFTQSDKTDLVVALMSRKVPPTPTIFELLDQLISGISAMSSFAHQHNQTLNRFLNQYGRQWPHSSTFEHLSHQVQQTNIKNRHKAFLSSITSTPKRGEVSRYLGSLSTSDVTDLLSLPDVPIALLRLALKDPLPLPNLPVQTWKALTEKEWALLFLPKNLGLLAKAPIAEIPPNFPLDSHQASWIYALRQGSLSTLQYLAAALPQNMIADFDKTQLETVWTHHLETFKYFVTMPTGMLYSLPKLEQPKSGSQVFSLIEYLATGSQGAFELLGVFPFDQRKRSVDIRTLVLTSCVVDRFLNELRKPPLSIKNAMAVIQNTGQIVYQLAHRNLINVLEPLDSLAYDTVAPTLLIAIVEHPLFFADPQTEHGHLLEAWLLLLVRQIVLQDEWIHCPWAVGNLIYLDAVINKVRSHKTDLQTNITTALAQLPQRSVYEAVPVSPEILGYFLKRGGQTLDPETFEAVCLRFFEYIPLDIPWIQAQYNPISQVLYYLPNRDRVLSHLLSRGLNPSLENWVIPIDQLVTLYAPLTLFERLAESTLDANKVNEIVGSMADLIIKVTHELIGHHNVSVDASNIRRLDAITDVEVIKTKVKRVNERSDLPGQSLNLGVVDRDR